MSGLVFVFLALVAVCSAQSEVKILHEGIEAYMKSAAGKIIIKKTNGTDFTFELKEITEKAADGSEIGQTAAKKHKFNNFPSINFNLSEPIPSQVDNGDSISAREMAMGADLAYPQPGKPASRVEAKLWVAEAAGNVSIDGEISTLLAGSVKFNVDVSNWFWCTGDATGDDCGGKIGKYLDVVFEMKTPETPEEKDDRGDNMADIYDLGKEATMQLSEKVKVDSVYQDMADDFPKIDTSEGKTLLTIRLPKFTTRAIYDPIIQLLPEGSDTTGGGSAATYSVLVGLVAIFCTVFLLLP